MMYSAPYFRPTFFPPKHRRYSPKYAFPHRKMSFGSFQENTIGTITTSSQNSHASCSQEAISDSNTRPPKNEIEQKENRSCEDKPIFEVLGIKLYFDDLLILGLLFFLYSEGIQDQELFLALILLLFS